MNRRWRLILGREAGQTPLSRRDRAIDRTLEQLYEPSPEGGLAGSAPRVARWLGDIRKLFPTPVVQILQKDALDRLDLKRMLLEPELLSTLQPDVHLAATLLSLQSVLPAEAREVARQVVAQVVEALQSRLTAPLRQAVRGSLNRGQPNRQPRLDEINWAATIRANLKHYQPSLRTVVPQVAIGWARRRRTASHVILCVDQSGSMSASVVYAGIFGSVLASLPALRTSVVAFDTTVVDLSPYLADPVTMLFGTQLGGGTDINRALAYCSRLIESPEQTVLVLISDLFEGGNREQMLLRASRLVHAGVRMVALLSLSDEGEPSYDHTTASELAALGIPSFACTPDRFPDLMAAALQGEEFTNR